MGKVLLKALLYFAKSETAIEIAKLSTKKLVESTDSGIDDELAKELLGDISKSSLNRVTQKAVEEFL